MDSDAKLGVLYDYLLDIRERVTKIEGRCLFDRTVSAVAGFFGGAAAVFVAWILGKEIT